MKVRRFRVIALALLGAVALVAVTTSPSVVGVDAAAHSLGEVIHDSPQPAVEPRPVASERPTLTAGLVKLELFAPVSSDSRVRQKATDEPLENETRAAVNRHAVDRPGLHLAALAAAVGVPVSTIRYHVRVLERAGLVSTPKVRGKRRVFPASVDPDAYDRHAALADPPTARLLDSVDRLEPVNVTDLADTLDQAPSTVSHHVDRLVESELLDRDRSGRTVVVRTRARQAHPTETEAD